MRSRDFGLNLLATLPEQENDKKVIHVWGQLNCKGQYGQLNHTGFPEYIIADPKVNIDDISHYACRVNRIVVVPRIPAPHRRVTLQAMKTSYFHFVTTLADGVFGTVLLAQRLLTAYARVVDDAFDRKGKDHCSSIVF